MELYPTIRLHKLHVSRPPISAHPSHAVRGSIATEGSSGTGCMRHRRSFRHPSHTVRWPHRELHRRPQWQRLHVPPPRFSAHPSHGSWPPWGAPPKVPVAHTCVTATNFSTPLTRFAAA
eukprot:8711322-Pyramimonas_sp.AAC.2